jgi:hypothetical protein
MFNYNSRIIDPHINLQNDNMLYAQVDAVILPISRMGFGETEVHVFLRVVGRQKGNPVKLVQP